MGSCFESSSTKWDLDFAESSPNNPKWTLEWLKAMSPKNSKNGGTGGALRPKTLWKGSMARPSPVPKRSPRETAGEGEEEGAAASTQLLVMLRHNRKLGDAPTYKTHQGNGERTKRQGERGQRTRGEGTQQQWLLTGMGRKGSLSGL